MPNVFVDLGAPESEKRTNDGKIDIVDAAGGRFAHRAQAGGAGAAEQIHQESFDQIIGMMSEKNGATSLLSGDLGKERVTRFPRGRFDRHLLLRGKRADIGRTNRKIDIVLGGELFDEARIGIADRPRS